jgi:hypothetical protein
LQYSKSENKLTERGERELRRNGTLNSKQREEARLQMRK